MLRTHLTTHLVSTDQRSITGGERLTRNLGIRTYTDRQRRAAAHSLILAVSDGCSSFARPGQTGISCGFTRVRRSSLRTGGWLCAALESPPGGVRGAAYRGDAIAF